MAEESFQEKTEKATPRKRQDVRKKGQVAKSRELSSVAVLLSGLIVLTFFGSYTYSHIHIIMKETFSLPMLNDLNISDFMYIMWKILGIYQHL